MVIAFKTLKNNDQDTMMLTPKEEANNLVCHYSGCPSCNHSTSSHLSQVQTLPYLVTIVISPEYFYHLPADEAQQATSNSKL